MAALVLDVETSIKSPVGMKGHPAWPANKIVVGGICNASDEEVYLFDPTNYARAYSGAVSPDEYCDITKDMIVGCNVKFDMLYMMKHNYYDCNTLPYLWDVQLAEYLLSGQQTQYASLDALALKYGGTLKDSRVKAMWDAGMDTEDIPMSILQEYLVQDVLNTRLVFNQQMLKAVEMGMLPLIFTQMDALRATTIMAFNGMKVNYPYITESVKMLTTDVRNLTGWCCSYMDSMAAGGTVPKSLSPTSNRDLSLFLYGGTTTIKVDELVGTYKNGKDKYRKVAKTLTWPGLGISPSKVSELSGAASVDDEALQHIIGSKWFPRVTPFIEKVLELRSKSKLLETYFIGVNDLMFPDYRIYPQLVHVATKTGRLSCNKPNLQNQTTDGGVKDMYISRFGADGVLVEFDYAQLEMVALAFLSKDNQLIADLNAGIDMHSMLYEKMYHRAPTKEERKPFKSLSFGLVYGAGYKTLAANAKCSEADAKLFIKVFYDRYAGVAAYHGALVHDAATKRETSVERSPSGMPVGTYTDVSATGRRYVFKEYEGVIGWGKDKGKKKMSFSPTELKNWGVQGFATGDIVPMMVGHLVRELGKRWNLTTQVCPIMTVHDSILLDIKKEKLYDVLEVGKEVLESAPEVLKNVFGLEFGMELKVGCATGPTWGTLKDVK
jgi:DNA polymerase-1